MDVNSADLIKQLVVLLGRRKDALLRRATESDMDKRIDIGGEVIDIETAILALQDDLLAVVSRLKAGYGEYLEKRPVAEFDAWICQGDGNEQIVLNLRGSNQEHRKSIQHVHHTYGENPHGWLRVELYDIRDKCS